VAKGKKKRPGGGRPQGAKQAAKRSAASSRPAKAPAPGPSQSTKAAPTTDQPDKGQPTRGQPGKGPPKKPRPAKAQSAKTQSDKARPGRDQPTRAERIEAARRARRRKTLLARLAIGGVVLLLVVGVTLRILAGRKEGNETRQRLTAGSCQFDTNSDRTDPAPRNHVPNPTYRVDPPAGGNHTAQAARAAVYLEGQVPPDGQIVHAMEHGYVILWARPDLPEGERQALRDVAGRHQRDVLVIPRPSLPTKSAATAWGNRLLCGNVEPDALDLFIRTYRNQGPEKVPH
jgi:Protein of unknown function (DUF3105)